MNKINGGKEKIIVCTKYFFFKFLKHPQRIAEVAAGNVFDFVLDSKSLLTKHHYYLFSKILVLQKSQYSHRNKLRWQYSY